jgi:glycosyltransferase involved in cell wall biosynthesis
MKILLVCESFSTRLSGGKVVRYLHEILSSHGHDVKVAITSPFNEADTYLGNERQFVVPVARKERYYWRMYSLLNPYHVPPEFQQLVSDFAPDVVHFASFDHAKSPNLYKHCHRMGIRTVLQPWTMHFYCAQGFGYTKDRQCTRCIEHGYASAIREGCIGLRGALSQVERRVLQTTAVRGADVILSSNSDLDGVLHAYGIDGSKIKRFPIAFDVTRTAVPPAVNGDYYIFYGQAVPHKGVDFVVDLFSRLPDKKLKIYPMAPFVSRTPLPSNIEVIEGLSWANGLQDAIANAKAVLVPSEWMTSTEYSLCEAMTMHKPVIVFNVGVHKNILSHRHNAMVAGVRNEVEFRAALDELEQDNLLYEKVAAGGARAVAELNEPEKLYEQLMSAYRGG